MFFAQLLLGLWPVVSVPALGVLSRAAGIRITDEGREERAFRRSLKKDLS
jgi:hypothetical protein